MIDKLLDKMREKWQTVMTLIFLVVAITFSVSVFMPARYKSEVKMIIIQNHQSEDVDAFSAAKSAEYLSDIMTNVIFTESFIQDMLDAPFEVNKDFTHSSEKRMKIWKKTVDVDKENNTGILTIDAFDKSRDEAEKIADSVAWALNVRGSKYHGGGASVEIKIIDGPITSENPASPNVLVNTLLALIVGIFGSASVIYFFEDFELILFRRENFEETEYKEAQKEESRQKISESLEKIRKNLKNQMRMESSSMGDLEKQIKEEDSLVAPAVDEAPNKLVQIVEKNIEKSQISDTVANSRKGVAPSNLPIFEENEKQESEELTENGNGISTEKNGKGFISMEELNREAEKMGLTDNESKESNSKYEATSDEVKERLNKLLKGEL